MVAPDSSRVAILAAGSRASMITATLDPGAVSVPVRHRSVEELWFCFDGDGELWRSDGRQHETVPVRRGLSLSIPVGVAFQFRNTGTAPLAFLITTAPPWPGANEAVVTDGRWPAAAG